MVSDKGTEVAETITDGQIVGKNSEKLSWRLGERGFWNPGE
jgi:hypothetical protein